MNVELTRPTYSRILIGEKLPENDRDEKHGLEGNQTPQQQEKPEPSLFERLGIEGEPEIQQQTDLKRTRWTVAELLETDFPPIQWALPGIVPEGLTILAGRPKLGKSWLALQIAHAVGTGGVVMGQRVEKGGVLYLALEDGPRRLKSRLNLQGIPGKADITFVTSWLPLSNGGLDDLRREIIKGEYRLVVIDTFSRASGGQDDQQDLSEMTRIMGELQTLAITHHSGILIIDHHRKAGAFNSDPIDDILGSTGKAAACDCALGLYRERGKPGATLRVTGRDMPEQDLALSWDGELFCWMYEGEAEKVRADSEAGRVLAAMKNLYDDGELPTTKNIADQTGMTKAHVNETLQSLVTDGRIRRGKKIGVQQPYYPFNSLERYADDDDSE